MNKLLLCVGMSVLFAISADAQYSRYIIQLRNKATNPFTLSSPQQFLSQRAIDRRNRYSLQIDSTDLPVTPRYVDSIRLAGNVTILNVSKWLNSVTIQTTDAAALTKIRSFPFVQTAAPIALRMNLTDDRRNRQKVVSTIKDLNSNDLSELKTTNNTAADFYNYGLSYNQVHIHNGEFLHNIGLRGQNMIIGMLDAGYFNYTSLRAFDSVRLNGQILGTYDFVAREQSVVEDNAHGMQCFSIIAANIPGTFVGTAPKANFYLFRTEDAPTEYPIEEHNWVVAAERVDSAGGDVISSSLGYTTFDDSTFNYTYAQMNGNVAISTRGADLAAKKGVLVVNSAGNEGNSAWRYISAPADGDSVLAVGAVNTSGIPASFTSYGPTSDGQVKPDVASVGVGTVLQGTNNTIVSGNGTSFACPNMAGLATCLWQGFQEFNNMKIIDALRRAGSIASMPNDRIGFGIPDVKKATLFLLSDFSTANATASTCKTTINWRSKDITGMRYDIERRLPGETNFTKIGEKAATGITFTPQNHTYQDSLTNAQAGAISYRIRQVVDTALASFSGDYIDTVTVNLVASCVTTSIPPVNTNANIIELMPNPASNNFMVRITTTAAIPNLFIRIIDGKGRTMIMNKYNKQSGTSSFNIPVYQLAKGKYYVSVFDNQKLLQTSELIKL